MQKFGLNKASIKKIWYFLWEDDSVLSWIVSIIVAFVFIKFLLYPALGLLLGTSFPVVAVVSGSMEHQIVKIDSTSERGYQICGFQFEEGGSLNLDDYWKICGRWYEEHNISLAEFKTFSFKNGIRKGDIMVLYKKDPQNVKVGDIVVFMSERGDPIIHRVVKKTNDPVWALTTKGDHNKDSIYIPNELNEEYIVEEEYLGNAVFKIPLLGYVKIIAMKAINVAVGIFT